VTGESLGAMDGPHQLHARSTILGGVYVIARGPSVICRSAQAPGVSVHSATHDGFLVNALDLGTTRQQWVAAREGPFAIEACQENDVAGTSGNCRRR